MDPQPQKIGRYEILSTVGKGAMGVVYRAKDPLIGRIVAIKTVTVSNLLSAEQMEEFKARFFREAQAAGVLHHSNIVTIHDVGVEGGVPFMAMELVEGTSLSKRLKERGRIPASEAAAIIKQVASGLSFAHERGIVHRDIKPDNILIETKSHRAVVADFGVAHITTSELTRTGEILGTPFFMSPEQVLGNPLDGRSDLFSLGVVFYLALTGKRPFKGESISSVCYHIVHGTPDPLPPDVHVPAEFAPILERMLAKDPAARYPDGAALVQALDAALTGTRSPSSGIGESTLDLSASPLAGVPFTRAQTTGGMTGSPPPPPPPPPRPAAASGAYGPPTASGSYAAPPPAASGTYGAPGGSGTYGTAAGTGAGTLSGTGMHTVVASAESTGNRGLLVAVLVLLGVVAVAVAFVVGVVLASGSDEAKPPVQPPASSQGQPPPAAGGKPQPPPSPPVREKEPRGKGPVGKDPKNFSKETVATELLLLQDECSVTVIFETRIPAGRFQVYMDGQNVWDQAFASKRMGDGRTGFRAARTLSLKPGSVQAQVLVTGGRGDGFSFQETKALTLIQGQSLVVGIEARRFPPPQIIIKTSGG